MKNIIAKYSALALALLMLVSLFSCKQDNKEKSDARALELSELSDVELADFAELGEYKGLTVVCEDRPKGESVWAAIKKNVTVKAYPKEQVNYYVSQIEAQYKYYAEQADMSYEEMLREMGVTEDSILSQASSMAIDDVIYELVRRDAKITLSSQEKESHFDRYVSKYVTDYGYTEQYVRENMKEEIYGSMLYDKVTEYLITNNQFE